MCIRIVNSQSVRRKLLPNGESFVATMGLTAVAIILLVAGASSWWATDQQSKASQAEAERRAGELASLLATGVESLLVDDQLSPARRLVLESGSGNGIVGARVYLPNGHVLADSDPSEISAEPMPESWDGEVSPVRDSRPHLGLVRVTVPINIGQRGVAAVEIDHELPQRAAVSSSIKFGSLLFSSLGLGLLLIVYHRMRRRLGALSAIREALLALEEGEMDTEALAVAESFGVEAASWNRLLGERQRSVDAELDMHAAAAIAKGPAVVEIGANPCDVLPQGVLITDEELCVAYANGAAGVLLQRGIDELVGQNLGGIFEQQDQVARIEQTVRRGSRQRVSFETQRSDQDEECGQVGVLRVTARCWAVGDVVKAIVLVEDVTQQKMAEQSRKAFVDQATHELRTPLTNIRLYVEQAIDEGDDDPAVRAEALNVINRETRRLERIVSDMLSVSEIEAGSLQLRVDDMRLDQLFDELEMDYRAQAEEKGIVLRFDLPPKLPVLQADRDKFALAVHNMLGNAMKYTLRGGEVSLRVEAGEDKSLAVSVSDSGIGISDEDQERVFERFFRASDERILHVTGTGIGLSLARQVVRLHGGDITVESELNKGSTFTLTLPGSEPAKQAA